MGVAVGDVDNDGRVDLYRTALGPNQLFRNNGDGTFTDVTGQAGVGDPRWSVSASFTDLDRDGWLDLYVGNYLDHRVDAPQPECFTRTGEPDYCGPSAYASVPDRLYRNRGDGTFVDVTAVAGVAREYGAALGVAAFDADGDGWTDVYVANDGEPNQLWMNHGNGTFTNGALLAGAALNDSGRTEGSMGVDAGDFDGDGDDDLFMTHLTRETNTLYVNDGLGLFEDRTATIGLGAPSLVYTGFGTAWLDFDNDGWLDLLAVNGAVQASHQRFATGALAAPVRAGGAAAARPAEPALPQPRERAFRRGHPAGGPRVPALGGEPGRSVRRHRQRRRRGRAGHQQQWSGAVADQRGRPPQPLARSPAGRGVPAAGTCRGRESGSSATTGPRCGDGRGRTAATLPPTTRGCWLDWARPPWCGASASPGRAAARRTGRICPWTGG